MHPNLETNLSTRDFVQRVGAAWLAISAIVLLINIAGIMGRRFPDPDDIMRLIQVRDLIDGQGWFDLHQYRVDTPNGGVNMHWSRLVDIPLVLIIGALTPMIGGANAEIVALVVMPLITLGIAMLLACRIVWKTLGEDAIPMTCIVMVLSVPLLFQLGPMRIDHHGWQIVGALIAVNGMLAQNPRYGGLVAGLAMAVWLSISIEGLPLAAAICALLALRWWRSNDQRDCLVAAMFGLASGSFLLFVMTRGLNDLAIYCDAIGLVHIALFFWGAVILGMLAWFNPASRLAVLIGFGVAGGGGIAILLSQAPECAGSSFNQLDPVLIEYWYEHVVEGMPIWRQSLRDALQITILPLLGLYASVQLARRNSGSASAWWKEYSLLIAAAFLIAMLVARAGAIAAALAAVPFGWQLREWLRNIREMQQAYRRFGSILALVLALAPILPLMLIQHLFPIGSPATVGASAKKASTCNIGESAKQLAQLPIGEIYAPFDIAPNLLLDTDHQVIATGHHRGEKGMAFVVKTAIGSSENAHQALRDRGTDYVALCADLNEAAMYAFANPQGFVADLSNDNASDWLEPIELSGESNLLVWKIKGE